MPAQPGRPRIITTEKPPRPPSTAPQSPSSRLATLATVLAGTAVWALFLWGGLHAQWIGVDPMGAAG